ncbi:hypothetical protein K523DRAFT_356813 [Schizophyllum commune Tattone D]|nr:hypothetical protein K523DRAFT_356813 [Schizophyllum commune Tattone D]
MTRRKPVAASGGSSRDAQIAAVDLRGGETYDCDAENATETVVVLEDGVNAIGFIDAGAETMAARLEQRLVEGSMVVDGDSSAAIELHRLYKELEQKPHRLLFDVPTKRLDLGPVVWLKAYLSGCNHNLAVVSAVSYVLTSSLLWDVTDFVCTNTIDLTLKKLVYYVVSYSASAPTLRFSPARRLGDPREAAVKPAAKLRAHIAAIPSMSSLRLLSFKDAHPHAASFDVGVTKIDLETYFRMHTALEERVVCDHRSSCNPRF